MNAQISPEDKKQRENNHRLLICNLVFLGVGCVLFGGLLFIIRGHPEQRGLLAVATGFVGFGATIGFLVSTYSAEKETISPVTAALHGLVGGAAVTDIAKDDSVIRHVFHLLAGSGNLPPGNQGLVLAIAAAFGPLGFFFLYLNRKLDFNLAAASVDQKVNEATLTLAANLTPTAEKIKPSSETTDAAQDILNRPNSEKTGTFEERLNEGKAHFALGHDTDAADTLRKALELRPGDPDATMYLAATLARLHLYDRALELLEGLLQTKRAPIEALRLLGYVLLFCPEDRADHKDKIRRAIEVNERYLAMRPDDSGARVNLACAYAQLGATENNVIKVRAILTSLLPSAPEARELVANLTGDDGDFKEFKKFDWFNALIKG